MSAPFFSIVIPTKNRSFLVKLAVQSLLRQTFKDFEIVLVDNDDTPATHEVVASFQDARLKYFRTGGRSMPDNWEFGLAQAQGEYVCLLEDKQAYKGRTLERIYQEVERERPGSVKWRCDTFDDADGIARLRLDPGDGRVHWRPADDLLAAFLGAVELNYKSTLPLVQRGCLHRRLMERIKAGPMQRLCPPVSPDIMLALSQLAHGEGVLEINAALAMYVSARHSNGRSFGLKDHFSRQFTKELGGNPTVYYDRVPIKASTIPGIIYNDYLTAQAVLQGRLLNHPVQWPNYFLQCRHALQQSMAMGVDMAVESAEWERALAGQPAEVQSAVQRALASKSPALLSGGKATVKQMGRILRVPRMEQRFKSWYRGTIKKDPEWRFRSVMEYLEWEDSTPGISKSS